ncbi:hypothetical protein [Saccharothrix sp. HUAS TT1]|uniref:hypothetical protein n=1 Tax=unclassified Saccharothrix TaxID=2593673 RepID=UPI00345B7DCE
MSALPFPEITAANFPTPHLALRGTADDAQVRAFAGEQARAARRVHTHLAPGLVLVPTAGRVDILTAAYDAVVLWRQALAASAADARYDATGRPAVSRYSVTIDQDGPNCDRVGEVGRLRAGARWDAATGRWTGGDETPASRIVAAYGHAVQRRFAMERPHSADTLINDVWLPITGRRIQGNMLVRGEAARDLAVRLAARLAERRGVAEVETTGDLLYAVTASPKPRRAAFREAMMVLASAEPGDWSAWWTAAYLLYQGPQYKKGSDACNRVFLAAVGAALLGQVPVIPQDIDLRCMVLGQAAVTATPLLCGQVAA